MGRPVKTNADWWKHPAGFRDDKRMKVIRQQNGIIGYALYNMLIEVLLQSDHFSIFIDETELLCQASDFGVEIEELTGVIKTGISINLLAYDEEGALYSPLLNEAMQALLVKRSRDKARISRYRSDNGREYPVRRDNSDIEAIFATPPRDKERQSTE